METARLTKRWLRWAEVLAQSGDDPAKKTGELPRAMWNRQTAITAEMEKLQVQIQRRLQQRTNGPHNTIK
jgi:hypothetical protein